VTTIGSLFSGVGGLDLAVEAVTGGRTVWQVEREPAARRVLARHWPDADRSCVDVREARGLAGVDVICGGFPCQDLSVAGTRTGLHGARSGLFFELARVVGEVRPSLVVLENVPGVAAFRAEIEAALPGYGCRWVKWSATAAGAPHLRRRVLIVATRGGGWLPDVDLTVSPDEWAQGGRLWPTPSVKGNDNVQGASPTSGDGLATAARAALWATPRASDDRGPGRIVGRSTASEPLSEQARTWPTPCATDYKGRTIGGTGRLPDALEETARGHRLNAAWVEALMGWPVGWTEPDGESMRGAADALLAAPRWPRGRPPADWSGPWPGYEWEPDRTETGPPTRGRPARLRACGNGVVPQAAAMALRAALQLPRQGVLL
jgi:DNA (cytosine-5)-methyltransferase 1